MIMRLQIAAGDNGFGQIDLEHLLYFIELYNSYISSKMQPLKIIWTNKNIKIGV